MTATTGTAEETATAPRWTAWRQPVRYCVTVYVVVRAGLFALGLLAVGLFPGDKPAGIPGWGPPPLDGGWHQAITAWERADAQWYLRIASQGYRTDDQSGAYFPLYPVLTHAVGFLTGGRWLLAAYLVSNASVLVALVLLYRLTALELSDAHARRVVVYACVFPTGFFLFAPYTESLFLALSVGCLYAARRRHWALAAGLGALAAATRSPGVLLGLALVVEAVLQAREDGGTWSARWRPLSARLAAAAAVGLGLLAYLAYWQHFGDWRRPFDLQRSGWGKEYAWPWQTLWRGARLATQFPGSFPGGYFLVDALVVALVLATAVWVALRMRATYAVYLWASVLFPLLLMWPSRPLLSVPRIYAVLFPAFWALSRFAERWRAHDVVLVVSGGSMALLGAAFVGRYPLF
ncbi:MAG: integral rane protein-like protein [Frankiales bacterium]|nr:integral rane protein-like protein [Frankiales bacterium]